MAAVSVDFVVTFRRPFVLRTHAVRRIENGEKCGGMFSFTGATRFR